jgi:predicted transcriptional regulator
MNLTGIREVSNTELVTIQEFADTFCTSKTRQAISTAIANSDLPDKDYIDYVIVGGIKLVVLSEKTLNYAK